MKHLGISGGGTKISGLFGAAEIIMKEKGYQPDIISGVSAGAVLSVPLALGKYRDLKESVLSISLDTFFSHPPVKTDGSIRIFSALKNLILGRHYLGEQFNLEKALAMLVSRSEFDDYKTDSGKAICVVGSVDFTSGKRVYVNLKDVSYEHYLKFVHGASAIPIFTTGVSISEPFNDMEGKTFDNVHLYDGGVRDHCPTQQILRSDQFKITESVSVFSRPMDNESLDPGEYTAKNMLQVLLRYVDISNTEISKNDEHQELRLMEQKGIKNHGQIFLPRIMKGVYDTNTSRLTKLYEAGRQEARKSWED